jgi:hypothetical protein
LLRRFWKPARRVFQLVTHNFGQNMIRDRRLLSLLNRAAHEQCRRDYAAIRAELMRELDGMQAGGATVEEMAAALADRARQARARALDDAAHSRAPHGNLSSSKSM